MLARHEVEALCADRRGDRRDAEAQTLEDLETGAAAAAKRDDQRARRGHVVPDVLDLAGHPDTAQRVIGPNIRRRHATHDVHFDIRCLVAHQREDLLHEVPDAVSVGIDMRRADEGQTRPGVLWDGRPGQLDRVDRVDHGLDARHAPGAKDPCLPVRRGEQQIEPTADRQLLPSNLPRLEPERRPPERSPGRGRSPLDQLVLDVVQVEDSQRPIGQPELAHRRQVDHHDVVVVGGHHRIERPLQLGAAMSPVLVGVHASEREGALDLRIGRLGVDHDDPAAQRLEVGDRVLVGPRLVRKQADVGERAEHADLVVEPDRRAEDEGIGQEGGDDERLHGEVRIVMEASGRKALTRPAGS